MFFLIRNDTYDAGALFVSRAFFWLRIKQTDRYSSNARTLGLISRTSNFIHIHTQENNVPRRARNKQVQLSLRTRSKNCSYRRDFYLRVHLRYSQSTPLTWLLNCDIFRTPSLWTKGTYKDFQNHNEDQISWTSFFKCILQENWEFFMVGLRWSKLW